MGALVNLFDNDNDEPTIGDLRELLNQSITNKTRLEAEIRVMEANMGDPTNLSDNERKRYEAMIGAQDSLNRLIKIISKIKL